MRSDTHHGGELGRDVSLDLPVHSYDVLRNPVRLRILEVLGSFDRAVSLETLVSELRTGSSPETSDETPTSDLRTALVHVHLPKLAEYDVIDWDGDAVSRGDNAVPDENVSALLGVYAEHDGDVLETLVHPVRMAIVRLLRTIDRAYSIDTLARQLVELNVGSFGSEREAKIGLHHSHLPAMEEIEVLEYSDGWVTASARTRPTVQ